MSAAGQPHSAKKAGLPVASGRPAEDQINDMSNLTSESGNCNQPSATPPSVLDRLRLLTDLSVRDATMILMAQRRVEARRRELAAAGAAR